MNILLQDIVYVSYYGTSGKFKLETSSAQRSHHYNPDIKNMILIYIFIKLGHILRYFMSNSCFYKLVLLITSTNFVKTLYKPSFYAAWAFLEVKALSFT